MPASRVPARTARHAARRTALCVALAAPLACARDAGRGDARGAHSGERDALVVLEAGSLARPLRAALDSFARRDGTTAVQESAGSLETARKITELGRVPDVVALADDDLFPRLLVPAHVRWYARFGGNRMVIARRRPAPLAPGTSWVDALTAPGVEVGRADPNVDPGGYRALLVMQLAERHYRRPGLAARLAAASPARDVRPKEADLVALVQAGELDYAWVYESVARSAGLQYFALPHEIDLGDPADAALYAAAALRVRGGRPGDSITVRGAPIVYAASVPPGAAHRAAAERFVAFLLSPDGRRALAAGGLAPGPAPSVVGPAPAAVAAAASLGTTPGDPSATAPAP